jgi:hypothetical protein
MRFHHSILRSTPARCHTERRDFHRILPPIKHSPD